MIRRTLEQLKNCFKTHFFLLEIQIEFFLSELNLNGSEKMYEYLKERKSEGKFTKNEETKFSAIEEKIKKLYDSYNTRIAKATEKETKKQVRDRINALTIEQKSKLLFLLDSVEEPEEIIPENLETLNEEPEEA